MTEQNKQSDTPAPAPRDHVVRDFVRHAFMTGAGYGDFDKISDADQRRWSAYEPPSPQQGNTLRRDGFAAGFEAQQAGIDEDANPYEEGSDQWRDWNEGWESANEEEPDNTPSPESRVVG